MSHPVIAVSLSPHFSLVEMACHDGTPYPQEWIESRLLPLVNESEAVRAIVGVPIVVSSAYRTAAWNRKVGGSRHSQHVHGRALDLRPTMHMDKITGKLVNDYDPTLIYNAVMARLKSGVSLIRGIGLYTWGTHIDTREQAHVSRWAGTRVQPEVLQ